MFFRSRLAVGEGGGEIADALHHRGQTIAPAQRQVLIQAQASEETLDIE
jgi:hypothetical protein